MAYKARGCRNSRMGILRNTEVKCHRGPRHSTMEALALAMRNNLVHFRVHSHVLKASRAFKMAAVRSMATIKTNTMEVMVMVVGSDWYVMVLCGSIVPLDLMHFLIPCTTSRGSQMSSIASPETAKGVSELLLPGLHQLFEKLSPSFRLHCCTCHFGMKWSESMANVHRLDQNLSARCS